MSTSGFIHVGVNLAGDVSLGSITSSGSITTAGALNSTGTTALTWGGGAGATVALSNLGAGGTGGSLLINTPSINATFQSGLGIDGTFSYPDSVIRLHALGVCSPGGYQSSLQILTTHDQGAYAEERIAALFGPDLTMTSYGGVVLNTSITRPTAAVGYRGTLWVSQGAGGVADKLQICLKSAADSYSWKDVISG